MDTFIDIRRLEQAHIMAVAAHVLDKSLDDPILAKHLTPIDGDGGIKLYLEQHIIKSAKSPDAEAARFVGAGAMLGDVAEIFSDPDMDRFLAVSQRMANRLFAIMRPMESVASCDLVTLLFRSNQTNYLAILKLDHQSVYSHSIEADDDNDGFLDVRLTELQNALPQAKGKITACAIINDSDLVSQNGILLLEREFADDGPRWFLNRFLGAQKVLDRMEKTRIFRDRTEKWIRMNLKNDPDRQLELREDFYDVLLGSAYVDVKAFCQADCLSVEEREKLEKTLSILTDERLEVDRLWVTQKMKKRTVKTDTGFTLSAEHDLWNDSTRFERRRNNDGTYDYIFKGIRSMNES